MSHKDVTPKDFEGKTIARLEADAVNVIRFYFTDGTAIALEVDAVGVGIYGMVQCDVCVENPVSDQVKDLVARHIQEKWWRSESEEIVFGTIGRVSEENRQVIQSYITAEFELAGAGPEGRWHG